MSWEWELSRLSLALLAGVVLSHTGSLIQLTTRNEMASPSTMGMDGLAVAIVLANYAIQRFYPAWPLEVMGLVAIAVVALLLWFWPEKWLPLKGGRGQDFRFILLLGLSLNLLVGALFAIMQFLAMAFNQEFPDQLWFGRIGQATMLQMISGLIIIFGLVSLGMRRRRLWKALLLGSGFCHGHQIPVKQMAKEALWVAFIGNLWVITQFGAFSFLGLLFPLLLRQLSRYHGEPWRELTEGAFVCGAVFAMLDHVCYNFTFHGAEIPVGLPASLAGAAGLVFLLWQRFNALPGRLLGKDA